jgi:hypothetical protein
MEQNDPERKAPPGRKQGKRADPAAGRVANPPFHAGAAQRRNCLGFTGD